jgi:RNA polymerase sigma factor (sigma-70 family)
LIAAYKTGDREAGAALIELQRGLIFSFATRFMRNSRHNELEDYLQAGTIGVLEAAKRFDLNRSTKFGTYAGWWIRHEIELAFASGIVRVTRQGDEQDKLRAFRLSSSLGTGACEKCEIAQSEIPVVEHLEETQAARRFLRFVIKHWIGSLLAAPRSRRNFSLLLSYAANRHRAIRLRLLGLSYYEIAQRCGRTKEWARTTCRWFVDYCQRNHLARSGRSETAHRRHRLSA